MTAARLRQILKRFGRTRLLVIGDLILDEFVWGSVERISPEAPVPVVWAERESVMPGGAANVADNIRALGGRVSLLGVIGQDAGGARLTEELKRRGLPTEEILIDPGRPTTLRTRVIAHHQQVVRIDREKVERLSPQLVDGLIDSARRLIGGVDGVLIEDYGKGLITAEVLKAVIQAARRKGRMILVDPKEEHFSIYKGVTALTPNKKEAAGFAKVPIRDRESLIAAGQKIRKRLNPEALLITLGEEGMALFSGKSPRPVLIPTVAREVFDVSGAGDTVIAVLGLARAAGARFEEAARIANAAAGVVVAKVGTATCSPEELIRQMAGR